MNTQTPATSPWPMGITRGAAGGLKLLMPDGSGIELEAFRDACHKRAAELRRQAVADAFEGTFVALRRLPGEVFRLLRRTFARRHGRRVHVA